MEIRRERANVVSCRVAGYLEEPAEIDAVVEQLRTMESQVGLDRCVAIGGLILQRFFGGSAEIWRTRSRNKNNSVRRIAQHPDCPLSKSSLSEAIGVAIVVQELPFVRTSGHIGASHVACVLRLRADEQQMWLKRATLHRWGVRELRAQIQSQRLASRGRAGQRPLHAAVILLRRAVRACDRAARAIARAELSGSDSDRVRELARELIEIESRLHVGLASGLASGETDARELGDPAVAVRALLHASREQRGQPRV
jgi:hypothetical protein